MERVPIQVSSKAYHRLIPTNYAPVYASGTISGGGIPAASAHPSPERKDWVMPKN